MIDVHGVMWLSPAHYYLFTGLATAAAVGCLYLMLTRLQRARWIEDTPTSRVRSAAQGLVELNGMLDAGGHEPLLSPLAKRPCLWYRFRVEEHKGNSDRDNQWRTVEQGVSERPFLLRDSTGVCWINPLGAEVHPKHRRRWEGNQRWPADKSVAKGFLGGLLRKRYRYTEEWFVAEEPLYAIGWFESRGGGRDAVDMNALSRQVISNWKADFPDLLARFDRNGDGKIDLEEWERVRRAANQAAELEARTAGQAPVIHALRKPPRRGLPFVLSDHHEEDLSRRLRGKSRWALIGLAVSGTLACWLWLA
ncbi:GIDE domain-containing protein [Halopseudomonas sp.]|uniref:GIDE domain-containing protein n=1 Tax=Halopseudomonas sp. TaxID=2901191 RepID=UPI003002B27B